LLKGSGMTEAAAARRRIAAALAAVAEANTALRAARSELERLDLERERELEAAIDGALLDEDEGRADPLAEEAERLSEQQDGLGYAVYALEAMIDMLRTDASAPLRQSARRLRPAAPAALECPAECPAELGGRP
jgi:hypothetical protein